MNWLVSLLTGPILKSMLDAWKMKLDSTNARDQLAADLVVKQFSAEIEARKSANAIIIAEQGRWWTAMIRPLLAAPVIIFLWKVIVWDKVLGWGTTDAINGAVGEWAAMIVTTYVGGLSLEKVAKNLAGIFK